MGVDVLYDEARANQLAQTIVERHLDLFRTFAERMWALVATQHD